MKIIKFTHEGVEKTLHPAPAMFVAHSTTRYLLRERGIDFENDEDILAWIIAKDLPNGVDYTVEEPAND
jgi:hypothetical protein